MEDRVEKGSWWSNNWKWAAPSGCLLLVLLFAACIGAFIYFVFSMMKSNEAYQHSLDAARHDTQVVAALGQPIEDGALMSGNFSENGGSGSANFSVPVSGPKGAGTIYVEATKSAGLWHYRTLVVEIDKTHQRIDLLHETAEPESK